MPADRETESEPRSLWERVERTSDLPRVTHAEIAAAGVEIADRDGLAAVTIRSIASRLEAGPMTLYRYVQNKTEILELMVDAVHATADPPRPGAGWREVLLSHAQHLRATMLSHPWLVQMPANARTGLSPRAMDRLERVLASVLELKPDLDFDELMAMHDTVTAYAYGATAAEIMQAELVATGGLAGREDLRAAMAPQMRWLLSTGRYPQFERYCEESQHKDDMDWRYQVGLESVLDGIERRLGTQ